MVLISSRILLSLDTTYIIVFPLPQPQFTFFTWFFHLHFILCKPKCFCSLTVLTVSVFLSAVSVLIYDHLLFRSSPLHICVSGHFTNRWDILSSVHRRHLPLTIPPVSSLSFQIPTCTMLCYFCLS